MEVKLRTIVGGNRDVKGFTVPNNIAIFFPNCMFTVEKSGTAIVFYSGATQILTDKDIENYKFEDCKVGSVIQWK